MEQYYLNRAHSVMIGAALQDMVVSCDNINGAVGKDEDVYANLFDILTCVLAITEVIESTDDTDKAHEMAIRSLDLLVKQHNED